MTVTREEFNGTTKAKSDQMNAVDLIAGPAVFVITDIRMTGASDQPVAISLDAHTQPWKPSKTFRRVLAASWSGDPSEWIGRHVVLWCDPTITWAGEKVGGIAISHMSHIDGEKVYKLNESKSKKKTIKIQPYYPQESDQPDPEPTYWPDDAFANQLKKNQAKIDSGELAIQAFIDGLQSRAMLTAGQKARIKVTPVYTEDAAQIGSDEPPAYDGDDPFAGE